MAATGLGLVCAPGCGSMPRKLTDQPAYYFDNSLPFQPGRIWRLKVKWEPYLLDSHKALVLKQFQYILRGERERKRLESEIIARGGDERYLRWFESEVAPLGAWEKRQEARIGRFSDIIIVTLNTKALKEVPQSGRLTVSPVAFPDPLLRAIHDGCDELNWDVIPRNESVGFEVILESRDLDPGANRWQRVEHELPNLYWRQWSVGEGRSISYRTAINFKANVSRCPLPPKVYTEFQQIGRAQPMGVDW